MPSKKRKYNARFPAGRIKKIMQTDEEVGKVAQAVPIIICLQPTPRTLELFVESLLGKAMQVTVSRNAKTLSPSHVKQCILAESRFDFLRDLVKNIPDVSAAEEKEMMSAENSPNSSRFSDVNAAPCRIVREDSNSSSSSDVKLTQIIQPPKHYSRVVSTEIDPIKIHKTETITSTIVSNDAVIDLSKKTTDDVKTVRTANFYQETLLTDEVQHRSVIKVNPTYSSPQPSTSSYATLTTIEPLQRVDIPVPKPDHKIYLDLRQKNNNTSVTPTPRTPVTPILNIDFTKNLTKPEIKVLDTTVGNVPYKITLPKKESNVHPQKELLRQNSKTQKMEFKGIEISPPIGYQPPVFNVDHLGSGNLQIDEDYDI